MADDPSPATTADSLPRGVLVSVRGLKTHYFADEGTTKAVDGASFDIMEGRTLGIVGETGCGKSVTARSIVRIVESPGRIVAGRILMRLEDEVVDLVSLPKSGRRISQIRGGEIGLVFQEPMTSFSPVHTIGNQLVEAVRLHGDLTRREAEDRAVELLEMLQVPRARGRLQEYSWQLSGGLRQRAMIAMALAGSPRLLIADEPTTALDVTTQSQILALLRGLQRDTGMAILLITHDLGVIAEMADDVAVMYLGRVVEQAPVDDVFHRPQHPYTRGLLASIPSIDATPKQSLPTISGVVPNPFDRPSGCSFHPRCPDVIEGVCDVVVPRLRAHGADHDVRCHLFDESPISLRSGGEDDRQVVGL